MRVIESSGDADLAQEALVGDRAGEVGVEHLDRDVAVVLEIARQEDGRHATAAELALDRVPARERRLKVRCGERRHHRASLVPIEPHGCGDAHPTVHRGGAVTEWPQYATHGAGARGSDWLSPASRRGATRRRQGMIPPGSALVR